ncbi:MAG TPA: PEP/pyruvate-binding domain-containing protein [Kiritimatiellia bacterium]|nr:PEP/pyruvate-binding domain-containing protein [Kiritimatiellia bacterium]
MQCTTGLPGLDAVLKGVMPGDNVVWMIEDIADYRHLVIPYVEAACRGGRQLHYFRFATHPELIAPSDCHAVHRPDPNLGFEPFVDAVHQVITENGNGALYLFDCLSELAHLWQADAMLGNFFMLTCPRLLEFQSLTYFSMLRNHHSPYAVKPIEETAQFVLDVFRRNHRIYLRPLKVQYRSGDVMNLIHVEDGDAFLPVKSSAEVTELLASLDWPGLQSQAPTGLWHRAFHDARELAANAARDPSLAPHLEPCAAKLRSMLLGGDPRIQDLCRDYLSLDDLLAIYNRMIGIGQIGGKAVGMLLARAIVSRDHPDLARRLELHDSFFLGSQIYFTFLVRNKAWWIRQRQRNPATFLDDLHEAREKILHGTFPAYILDRFRGMLDYFGEAPYIVRSSSLLEDAYGNAFAGQYESVFCVNQGPPEQRLHDLLDAIRRVYASALSESALRYRQRRGLLDQDEQMALLIMRVSGAPYGRFFYPHLAGVGLSYNPFVWNKDIDPKAGVVRLVFGLGTRAVDRADDDSTRLVALNAPLRRPESSPDEILDASQQKMDCLDLHENRLASGWFQDIAATNPELPLHLLTTLHPATQRPVLTFDPLLSETDFPRDLRRILSLLEQAYQTPVDIEFSANILSTGDYRINLLQCRPLQIHRNLEAIPQESIPPGQVLLDIRGPVIGASRLCPIDRVVIVRAETYARLPEQQRHAVARLVGAVNRVTGTHQKSLLLIGPGRWGTRQPSLGVPVRFTDINHAGAVCELALMHDRLVPDASLGTHFLNELIEADMLYLAADPNLPGNTLDLSSLLDAPNQIGQWINDLQNLDHVVHALDTPRLHLRADVMNQTFTLFHPPQHDPTPP